MSKSNNNPMSCWDLTIPYDNQIKDDIMKLFNTHCKKGAFQLEEGEGGYKHWQCRISLKKKNRKNKVYDLFKSLHPGLQLSPTSKDNIGNFDYVTKDLSRIDGPFFLSGSKLYIPMKYRGNIEWNPFQRQILNIIATEPDDRTINVIVDDEGNNGKSFLAMYLLVMGLGRKIPQMKDHRDLMRMVMDLPESKCYLFDLPRAISKNDQHSIYSAIEEIKNGYAYDDRYNFREKVFESPHVFVFTNNKPQSSLVSKDRWKLWYLKEGSLLGADAVTHSGSPFPIYNIENTGTLELNNSGDSVPSPEGAPPLAEDADASIKKLKRCNAFLLE